MASRTNSLTGRWAVVALLAVLAVVCAEHSATESQRPWSPSAGSWTGPATQHYEEAASAGSQHDASLPREADGHPRAALLAAGRLPVPDQPVRRHTTAATAQLTRSPPLR